MVVLVSGGAGYIGSHAVRALSASGHTPVVIDNFSTGHREFVRGIDCVEADVGDKAAVMAAVKKYGVDAAMHFASFINKAITIIIFFVMFGRYFFFVLAKINPYSHIGT